MDGRTYWQMTSFVHHRPPLQRADRSPIICVDSQEQHVLKAIERAALVGGIRLRRVPPPNPALPLELDDEASAA